MVTVKVVEHALRGALVTGGCATLLQSLLARQLQRPGSLAQSLATFVGLFRVLEDIERRETGDDERSPFAGALAAAVALAVLDAKRRGLVLSVVCTEAIVSAAQRFPWIQRIKHKEFIVGMVVYTQLIYTWIYRPDLYSTSQLGALDRFCLRPKSVTAAMRAKFPTGAMESRCEVWHPHDATCTTYHIKNFFEGMPQLMKLYFPIFAFTTFVLKSKRWMKGPRPSIVQVVTQFLRTTVALKMSSQLGVVASCYFPVSNHEVATYLSGVFTTLCLVFENEKRRVGAVKTIAIYVLCTSGTWTANCLHVSEPARQSWKLVLIALAFGSIFSHPQSQNPRLMELLYGRSLRKPSEPNQTQTQTRSDVKKID